MPPQPSVAAPTPAELAAAIGQAQSHVAAVVNTATDELREVGEAAAGGVQEISEAVSAVANDILAAVNRGVGDLQRAQSDAVRALQELVQGFGSSLPELSLAQIRINGEAIDPPDPTVVYRRLLALIERGESPIAVRIEGPLLAGPLMILTKPRDDIRRFLLGPFGLQGTPILTPNPGDAVLITAIICLTICYLAVTLLPAVGVGVVLMALGAAIVMGISNGYEISADGCHRAGMTLPGGGSVGTADCLTLNITKPA